MFLLHSLSPIWWLWNSRSLLNSPISSKTRNDAAVRGLSLWRKFATSHNSSCIPTKYNTIRAFKLIHHNQRTLSVSPSRVSADTIPYGNLSSCPMLNYHHRSPFRSLRDHAFFVQSTPSSFSRAVLVVRHHPRHNNYTVEVPNLFSFGSSIRFESPVYTHDVQSNRPFNTVLSRRPRKSSTTNNARLLAEENTGIDSVPVSDFLPSNRHSRV